MRLCHYPYGGGFEGKGARIGTVAAFIMVSPLLSPQTVILTYALLGWKFSLARVVFFFSRCDHPGNSIQLF